MRKNILVMGGTRYFGKLLVQRLLQAGHAVTIATRGRAQDPFGERVTRMSVDRRNEQAMLKAFANAPVYDIIYDQLCYSPVDAAIAVRVFAGKVKRYIMASTIEVYRDLMGAHEQPIQEDELHIMAQPINTQYPWHDPALAEQSYAMGKRQAEAYLYRDGSLPAVTVRIGHVLAGAEDFAGHLADYVEMARTGAALAYSNATAASSFISAQGIADFLVWVGMQSFEGPVNAASGGGLSAYELFHRVGAALNVPVKTLPSHDIVRAGELSPFDYASSYLIDTSRAASLGYQFGHNEDWLDDLIRQHDLAYV